MREEMEKIGAQEFLLPALLPAELWKKSGPLGRGSARRCSGCATAAARTSASA